MKKTNTTKTKEIDEDLLIIIDKKESNKDQLEKISPEDINSVNVLKEEKAITKYGEKGKNGVIEVFTKDKKPWKIEEEVNVVTVSEVEENPWKINPGVTEVNVFEADRTNPEDINFLSKKLNDPNSKILIIKNKEEITKEEFFKIPSYSIKSITILKDEKAVIKYGDKGKDGVIENNSNRKKSLENILRSL